MPPTTRTMKRNVRRFVRIATVIGAAASWLLMLLGPEAALAGKRVYKLRPGLTLTTISRSKGPYKVRILTVTDPARTGPTLDVGSPWKTFPGTRRPSEIGAAYGAAAAINGDFGRDQRPFHPNAEDGDLRTSGIATGVTFAMSANETRGMAKRPKMRVRADTTDATAGEFGIDTWNATKANGRIDAYTPVGGSAEKPKKDVCSARLLPAAGASGERRLGSGGEVVRTYIVERQEDPCPFDAPTVGDAPGAVVITAKRDSPKGNRIRALDPGEEVTLSWTVGLPGALDVIGGAPQLIADPDGDGNPTVKAPRNCGSYFCDRNPRSGVGVNNACVEGRDGCKVFLMTVDGRQPGWSVGMDLVQFAHEFERAGADFAINLDGGGGAAMWVAERGRYCQVRKHPGCLVTRPSDATGERPANSALLIMPNGDPGDPFGAAVPSTLPAEGQAEADLAELALTDPGSTGGLLDAMFSGGIGRAPVHVPGLRRDVRIYRASQQGR
jgi:hypothetical protein